MSGQPSRPGSPSQLSQAMRVALPQSSQWSGSFPEDDTYRPGLLLDVLFAEDEPRVADTDYEEGEVDLHTLKQRTIRVKTQLRNEIVRLDTKKYNALVRDALEKVAEYSKTVGYFTKQIMDALLDGGKQIEITLPGYTENNGKYTFSRSDITHIQKQFLNVVRNLKNVFRSTKKSNRGKGDETKFSGVFQKLFMAQPFQVFAIGLSNAIGVEVNNQAHFGLSRADKEGNLVRIVDVDKENQAKTAGKYFSDNSQTTFLSQGLVQKITAMSAIYISAFISNIKALSASAKTNLKDTSNPNVVTERNRLKAMSVDELELAKKAYLGGTFAAPDYMVAAFGANANWNPASRPYGRSNHNHATASIVEQSRVTSPKGKLSIKYKPVPIADNQNTVFQEMAKAQQVGPKNVLVSFNEKAIPMNLVNRIISMVTIPAKFAGVNSSVNLWAHDPTVAQAFVVLMDNSSNQRLNGEYTNLRVLRKFFSRVHGYHAINRDESRKFITSVIANKKRKTKAKAAK